jgi:hypothetical protein
MPHSLIYVLLVVDLVLVLGEALKKVDPWATDFALVVTMLIAFWGRG